MRFNLSQSAEATGKSKSVIWSALKSGKLSYISKDSSGYEIDSSELFRVFKKVEKEDVERKRTERKEIERERIIKNDKKERGERKKNEDHNDYIELKQKLFYSEANVRDLEKDIKHLEEKNRILLESLEKAEGYISAWQKQANQLLLQAPSKDRVEAPPEKEGVEDREELIKRVQRETIKQHKEYLTKNNLLNESPLV
jgi:hypothetical protein